MRKILGIILSALMLMTISAFAEETAMNAELAFVTGAVNLTDTDDFNVVYSVYNKSITNRVTATAVYTLSDENGNVIWNGGDEVIIPAGSTKKFEFAGNVSKYGVHTLNVLLTDKNSGAVLRGEKEIALSKSNTGRNEYSGVSAHFAWSSNPNSTIPLLGKMGSKYVRDEIYWKDYELEKGKYVLPEKADEYIDMLVENDIEPVIILDFGNKLYTDNNDAYPKNDTQIKAYGEYVYHLVKDLKGRVKYFEVWNEFNLSGSGSEYAKILKTAYLKAKEANPDCKVIGPVTAGTSNSFFMSMKTAVSDIEKYMDILSYHEYYAGAPETREYENTLKGHADKLKSYFGSDKEIWLTEMGWSEGNEGITEKEAAMYTVRHFLNNSAEKIADKMFIYSWINHAGHQNPYEANLGLLNGDCSAKKGYVAMAAMNYFLNGTSFYNRNEDSDGNCIYTYKKSEQNTVSVVYNVNNSTKTITFAPEFEKTTVYDMYGNKIKDLTGADSITVNGAPVYIVSQSSTAVMEYETNRVLLCGEIEGALANEQIMLYVTNPGTATTDVLDNIVYIEQLTLGAGGIYEFSFPMDKGAGIYNIYIGYANSESLIGPVKLEVIRDVSGYTGVFAGLKQLGTIAEILSNAETVVSKGIIDNRYNTVLDAVLYAVGIKDNKPVWVKSQDKLISGYGEHEVDITLDKKLVAEADEIKLYLWQKDMIPVSGQVTEIR